MFALQNVIPRIFQRRNSLQRRGVMTVKEQYMYQEHDNQNRPEGADDGCAGW